MWARVVELMLGVWLALSPFVFQHAERPRLWMNDLACGAVVGALALLSFSRALRHAHFGITAVGIWLVTFGYLASATSADASAAQNDILVGLLLVMFSIVPNDASQPPVPWRRAVLGDDDAASIQRPPSDS